MKKLLLIVFILVSCNKELPIMDEKNFASLCESFSNCLNHMTPFDSHTAFLSDSFSSEPNGLVCKVNGTTITRYYYPKDINKLIGAVNMCMDIYGERFEDKNKFRIIWEVRPGGYLNSTFFNNKPAALRYAKQIKDAGLMLGEKIEVYLQERFVFSSKELK